MILVQKALIKQGDKYLIQLRSADKKYFPLHWDLPGGRLEENEDPLLGIVREVKEETNLDIRPVEVIKVFELDLDNVGMATHQFTVYSAEVVSGDLQLSPEHCEQRWATKEEILKLSSEPYLVLSLD